MTGTSVDPLQVASFRPNRTIHLLGQLFPELLRLATNLIKFPDEDIHAREVWPLHPEARCKVRSFRQTAPVRHAEASAGACSAALPAATSLAGAILSKKTTP